MRKEMSLHDSGNRSIRIAIAHAQFNRKVTDMLLAGCRRALEQAGLAEDQVDVFSVPGGWELPLAARQLAGAERYDGIIALGAVVRGEAADFELISSECARGVRRVSLDSGRPVR